MAVVVVVSGSVRSALLHGASDSRGEAGDGFGGGGEGCRGGGVTGRRRPAPVVHATVVFKFHDFRGRKETGCVCYGRLELHCTAMM